LQGLRDKCHIGREGVSLLGISDAAEAIGFRTAGAKISWEQLRDEVELPCIVHWNQNHFVVVYKVKKHHGKWWVYVSDPAAGLLKYSQEQFLKSWLQTYDENETTDNGQPTKLGIVLLLEPTPRFYKETGDEDKKFSFSYIIKYILPYKRYLAQLALAILTGSLLGLILPFLTQSVVDTGIGTGNINFVVVILVAQLMLTAGRMANDLISSWLSLHMTVRVSISLISDFLSKLMRLPIAFFDSKMLGDIMQRIGDHSRIQSFLTGSLISMAMSLIMFVVYGVIMAGYDITILAIFLVGSALYVGWVLLFLKRRRKLDYMRFQESAANQSNVVQLINGMQDIKLNGCEKQKRWEWERIQARLYKVSIKGLTLGQTQQIGGGLIDQVKNILISFIAAKAVIDGNMTLGMMMAMQYIIGQLNAPISQFISFVQESQDAKISMERLGEIHGREDEEPEEAGKLQQVPSKAAIELKNVTFQYDGPHSDKVLNDITLTIPPDKVTAIVGASGSGKTTMLKMILGFYAPVEGQVLLAGRPLSRYSDRVWRSCCGVVMQEGYVFSDTIAGNIGVSDEIPDMGRVRQAATIANIDDFVEGLPLGYNTRIGADGHGLSTGQKQRLLIARAAYKDAAYLLLDEATNSLDANNERAIMERLQKLFRGKTVIIVAHRLSTVKNADNIIVLDHGVIVEQGTHAQLVALKGYYYNLVKNQLELGN
jgi:ATP-binding cassette subfamily B protein